MAISKTGLSGRAQLTRGAPQQRSCGSPTSGTVRRQHHRPPPRPGPFARAAWRRVPGERCATEHFRSTSRRASSGCSTENSDRRDRRSFADKYEFELRQQRRVGGRASSTILRSSMTNLPTAAQLFGAPPPPVDPRQARLRPGSYTVVAGANSVINTPISRSCCAASMRPARATPPSPPPTASSTLRRPRPCLGARSSEG